MLRQYLVDCGFRVVSRGWRPDHSLLSLKERLVCKLEQSLTTKIRLENIDIEICPDNIENYFGQQILIGASHG